MTAWPSCWIFIGVPPPSASEYTAMAWAGRPVHAVSAGPWLYFRGDAGGAGTRRRRPMEDVFILSGVRTPIGKFGGALAGLTAPELGGRAIRAAVERAGV